MLGVNFGGVEDLTPEKCAGAPGARRGRFQRAVDTTRRLADVGAVANVNLVRDRHLAPKLLEVRWRLSIGYPESARTISPPFRFDMGGKASCDNGFSHGHGLTALADRYRFSAGSHWDYLAYLSGTFGM